MKRKDTIRLKHIAITAMLFIAVAFTYYEYIDSIAAKLMLAASQTFMAASLLFYLDRIQVSLPLIFLCELTNYLASIMISGEPKQITVDLALSSIGIFSSAYLIIRKLKKNNKKINLKNWLNTELKPFKTAPIIKLILIMCIVSAVFSIGSSLVAENENITLLAVTYTVLPVIIMILSIVACNDAKILRVIYYILWIAIICMANKIEELDYVSAVEPIAYLLTMFMAEETELVEDTPDRLPNWHI